MKTKNVVHKMIIQIAPIFICLELWKQWTSCKFEDQDKMLQKKMEYQILWNITTAMRIVFPNCTITDNWPNMCGSIERLQPVVKIQQVTWQMPETGIYKVNVDGSYNNRAAGIGGIIRNSVGDLVGAFSKPIQSTSRNFAKAAAVRFAVKWCAENALDNYISEVDSMIINNILINKVTSNRKLKRIIQDIVALISNASVKFHHCYREANTVADYLAKMAATTGRETFFSSYQDPPQEVRGLIQLDKWKFPSMRRRYDKCNFFVS